jgi:hypothetical protein
LPRSALTGDLDGKLQMHGSERGGLGDGHGRPRRHRRATVNGYKRAGTEDPKLTIERVTSY